MTGNTELAEMIANWLDVAQCGRVQVAVHSDPPNGWHPAVVGAPAAADKDPTMRPPSNWGGPAT